MMELTRFLEEKVETCGQNIQFMPFYKARLQQKEGTLSEFNVSFSTIETVKPGTEEKEFLQFLVNIDEEGKPSMNYFKIMAMGNRLLDKLLVLTVTHPDKTSMDVTAARGNDMPYLKIINIQLTPNCFVKAIRYYKVNQAIMDVIAKTLISEWETHSTEFVVNITLHY